ncbi:MAG: hypothetical protein JOY86_06705 [Candidatus Eremiobacteraeota bacterium]|nr:hypothetical protein [Candidatus Eremiobacteraeota bacterium]
METTLGRLTRPSRLLALVLAFALLAGVSVRSSAETAGQISTRNIILGAVAVAAGIIIYNNYVHRVAQSNTVVGYTADGGVVYGDGRVVYPNNGNVVAYLSNNGSTHCAFNGYGTRCAPARLYAYFPQGYEPPCWPPGHCKQYWKQHKGENEQGDENDQGHDNDQGHGHGNHGHGNG